MSRDFYALRYTRRTTLPNDRSSTRVLDASPAPLRQNHPLGPHGPHHPPRPRPRRVPLLRPPQPSRTRVLGEKLIFLPHALGGVIALLIGLFQFSTRLRQRNLRLHRLLGKVYVGSVVVAACTSLIISHHLDVVDQPETYIFWETCVQASPPSPPSSPRATATSPSIASG